MTGVLFFCAGLPNFRRGISPASELKPTDMKTVLKEIAIERKAITLGELLLEGTHSLTPRLFLSTIFSRLHATHHEEER